MKTEIECFPCFLRQTVIALKQLDGLQDDLRQEILHEVLSIIQKADMNKPPAYSTTFIHRTIRDRIGQDPFKKIKSDYNTIAMGLYPELKEKVLAAVIPYGQLPGWPLQAISLILGYSHQLISASLLETP